MLRHNQLILDSILQSGNYPIIPMCQTAPTGTEIQVNGKWMTNFGSNCYLNLSTHPRVIEAFCRGARSFGIGAGASRVTAGTNITHAQLEETIAAFKKTEDAIVLPTGYQANMAALTAIINPRLAELVLAITPDLADEDIKPKTLVLFDELVHASIIDGFDSADWSKFKSRRIKFKKFDHRNTADLRNILTREEQNYQVKIIVTDGVFSLHGRIAPLDQIVKIAKEFQAIIYVDDAHGTGTLGPNGHGTAEMYQVEEDVNVNMGTLSKAIGSLGGFIAGNKELCTYLRTSRPYIFSTAMPPPIALACCEAFNVIEEEPEIRFRLEENRNFVLKEINALGLDTCDSRSQIIPVFIGQTSDAKRISEMLSEEGIHIQAYYYPAVPLNEAIIRINIMSNHSSNQLDYLLSKLAKITKNFGII